MRSVTPWDPTSLFGSRWSSGRTWNSAVINIGWVELPPCQWPKVRLRAAKRLIKKVWTIFTCCFNAFITVFDKQANICCSIGSILRTISSRNHYATNQTTAIDRYQATRCSKDWPKHLFSSYLQFLHVLIYNFCMVVRIFKVATSLSIFSTTRSSLAQQIKQMKSNYKFW